MNKSINLLIQKFNPLYKNIKDFNTKKNEYFCIHRTWGLGEVIGIDEESEQIIVNFTEKNKKHLIHPDFFLKICKLIQNNHILVKKKKNPEKIDNLLHKNPEILVKELLNDCPNQSLPEDEIKNYFSYIIPNNKIMFWWKKTKKILEKDPMIETPILKNGPFKIRKNPISLIEQKIDECNNVNKKCISIYKYILDNLNKESFDLYNKKILTIFNELKNQLNINSSIYNLYELIYLSFIYNDFNICFINKNFSLQNEEWFSKIFLSIKDFYKLSLILPQNYLKLFIQLLIDFYPDKWHFIILHLIKSNNSYQNIKIYLNYIFINNKDQFLIENIKIWIDDNSIKNILLYWIAKNRNNKNYKKFLLLINKTLLLTAILRLIDFQLIKNKNYSLQDLLFNDKSLIVDCLENAKEYKIKEIAQLIIYNQGFNELTKKSLLARIIKKFNFVQSLVDNKTISPKKSEKDEILFISKKSFELKKAEYNKLINEEIPQNKVAIAKAKEYGDLKENSEYKMAKQDQNLLLAKKFALEKDFSKIEITNFDNIDNNKIGIGSIVTLENKLGSKLKYSILGAWDSNPQLNIISYNSPLGKSLLNKQKNDKILVKNNKGESYSYFITKIEKYNDIKKFL